MAEPTTYTATITSVTGSPVQRIVLEMPPDFSFRAGQYLEILHPDGPVPMSIASAPHRLPELHLHYQAMPDVPEATRMDELLAGGGPLTIRGPGGEVTLEPPLPAPTLIVAGGTGMAQAMSFVENFTARPPGAPVTLLWCADTEADFYLAEELEALHAPWLELVMIADAERSAANRGMVWLSRHGSAFAAPSAGASGPAASPVVLAGGPAFVHAACDVLRAAGVTREQMRSDVFSYAPLDD